MARIDHQPDYKRLLKLELHRRVRRFVFEWNEWDTLINYVVNCPAAAHPATEEEPPGRADESCAGWEARDARLR